MPIHPILREAPQPCAWHRKDGKDPRFVASQGKFITLPKSGTVFVCWQCFNKKRRDQARKALAMKSSAQHNVYNDFARAGIRFRHEYDVGGWPYDMAFPELRLLIEIDDPRSHQSKRGKGRDHFKTQSAESLGWTLKRVPTGPGLTQRCLRALNYQRERLGA